MLTVALVVSAVAVLVLMVSGWGVSLLYRDASFVDRLWGLGFVAVVWAVWLKIGTENTHQGIILAMVSLWGLRLSGYLTWRNWGHGEDFRYRTMRERHGRTFPIRSLFTVFLLQGVIMWVLALPLTASLVPAAATAVSRVDMAGALLWLVGFLFETVGDAQLARFKRKAENKGRVMDRGLWRYTRHPNYFGDALVWWGLWLVCASSPYGIYLVVSPILMTFFLLKVSGVALLERTITERRPEYADYIRRTSPFIPWPPKN